METILKTPHGPVVARVVDGLTEIVYASRRQVLFSGDHWIVKRRKMDGAVFLVNGLSVWKIGKETCHRVFSDIGETQFIGVIS